MLRGTGRTARRVLALVVVSALASVHAAATALPAGAAGAVVTFPEVEAINPAVTSYELTVADAGGVGTLVAVWKVSGDRHAELALPHEGTVAIPLGATIADNLRTSVVVWRCANATWSDGGCLWVDTSGDFDVFVEASAQSGELRQVGTTPREVAWYYSPSGLGTTAWRLLAADGSTLASGGTPMGTGGQALLSVPAGTPSQRGALELVMSVDGTPVGHLDGTQVLPVDIDGAAPPAPGVTLSSPEIYPYPDDYLDSITLDITGEVGSWYVVFVDDPVTGRNRSVGSGTLWRSPTSFRFNGRYANSYFAAGEYRLRVVSTDAAGNSSTSTPVPVTVRDERLRWHTWTRTVSAARSVIKRFVGPCGALRKPASRGWRGSLAYAGDARCRDPRKAYVQAIHGTYVPESVLGRYSMMQVSLTGGPSRGASSRSYLVLGYYRDGKKWVFDHREVLKGSGVRKRHGDPVGGAAAQRLIHDLDKRPYVAWSTGLAGGSRYDVKSFTVKVTYQRLEKPTA